MPELLPIILLVVSGAGMATQATLNVSLGRELGLCFFAFMFTVVQLIATVPPLLALGWPPRWEMVTAVPWWLHLAGVLGMPILAAMSFGLARTGTTAGLVAVLVGQLCMGLAVDAFGLFGAQIQAVSLSRVGGVALVVAGLLLVRR